MFIGFRIELNLSSVTFNCCHCLPSLSTVLLQIDTGELVTLMVGDQTVQVVSIQVLGMGMVYSQAAVVFVVSLVAFNFVVILIPFPAALRCHTPAPCRGGSRHWGSYGHHHWLTLCGTGSPHLPLNTGLLLQKEGSLKNLPV